MMMTRVLRACLASAAAFVLSSHSLAQAASQAGAQKQEQGGVAIEFEFEPQNNDGVPKDRPVTSLPGVARFRFTDATSGRPYAGIRPASWIQARRSQQVSNELSCEDKARQFAGGSLAAKPDIDLNSYRLVTLNQDDTVAFINPFVSLQNSKLESIVPLPSRGYDWIAAPESHHLFVSLRDADMVVVLDTVTRKIVKEIRLPGGSRPTRMALDPDGRHIWVGLDGRNEAALLHAADMTESARLPVGHGLHTLEMAADQAWAFVSNTEDSTVTIIDRVRQKRLTDVTVSRTPVAMGWSAAAQRLAVVGANGGQLELIDPTSSRVTTRIPLASGVIQLGLFDQGRYALAVNQMQSRVTLIDLAAAKVLAGIDVAAKPDQIIFSRDYAYVRGQGTANMSVINLEEARRGRLQTVSVPMGQSAPETAADSINVASVMARLPEGNGIVMANAPDRMLYHYAAGMMAPVGNFSNYQRMARGLLILDSSLSEEKPGMFTAPATFRNSGVFDVIVKSQNPAVTVCFPLTISGVSPDTHRESAASVVARLETVTGPAEGRTRSVMFRLVDGQDRPKTGVKDAMLLAVQQHGHWQQRVRPVDQGSGRYEARLVFPESGEFDLLLTVPSQGLDFIAGRLGRVHLPEATISNEPFSSHTSVQHAAP